MINNKYVDFITNIITDSDLYNILQKSVSDIKVNNTFLYFIDYIDECDLYAFTDFLLDYCFKLSTKYPICSGALALHWRINTSLLEKCSMKGKLNDYQYSKYFIGKFITILDEINFPIFDNIAKAVKYYRDKDNILLSCHCDLYKNFFEYVFFYLCSMCKQEWSMHMESLLIKCCNKINYIINKILEEKTISDPYVFVTLSHAIELYAIANGFVAIRHSYTVGYNDYMVIKDLFLMWLRIYIDCTVPMLYNYYKLTCSKRDELQSVIKYFLRTYIVNYKSLNWFNYILHMKSINPMVSYLSKLFRENKEFYRDYWNLLNYVENNLPTSISNDYKYDYPYTIVKFLNIVYDILQIESVNDKNKIDHYIATYLTCLSTYHDLLKNYKEQFINFTSNMPDFHIKNVK